MSSILNDCSILLKKGAGKDMGDLVIAIVSALVEIAKNTKNSDK